MAGKGRGGIMDTGQKQLYKVFRVGGREFAVYFEYDGKLGETHPAYPDFEEYPAYTEEGRPFATSAQESCPCYNPMASEQRPTGDCGGCGWFHREQTPYDPIGVCTCDARRRKNKLEGEKRE